MKRFFNIAMFIVASVAMVATSCNKEQETPITSEPPTVKIELKSQQVAGAVFAITATNAEEVYFYMPEDGGVPEDNDIKSNGDLVPDSGEVCMLNLTPGKEYTAYALAINGELSAKDSFTFTAMEEEQPEPFDGYELDKLVSAVYRNDNDALAGNYEFTFGNTTELGWDGDIQVFIDFYNVEDSDPLNPVLPNGEYLPESTFAPFTYNPSNSYVDIVADGEVISSPIFGTVTVERTGAIYTITVDGTLMLLDDMEFSARYTGSIQFVQGGTSAYEFFEEDVTLDFDEAQMRYWGGWFYPFCDDLGIEMFDGTFDNNGTLQKGYYLHLSRVFMPKVADYNAEYVQLAAGEYSASSAVLETTYCMPYVFEMGAITDYFGDKYFTGTYLQYVENGQVKKVGLVTGGSFTVEGEGENTKVTMNFVTDNGVNLALTFSGEILCGNFNDNDETMPVRPWTTLDADHEYNFPEGAEGNAFCFGEYMTPGFDNWMLMIYATNDEYPDGYGDMFTTEFIVETGGSRTSLPTGTYNISLDIADHTMFTGTASYAGGILFTWYGDLTPDAEGYSSQTAPIIEGTVIVEDAGNGNYHFTFNLVDDAGNKVTGEWTGKVSASDISESTSSTSHVATKSLVLRN